MSPPLGDLLASYRRPHGCTRIHRQPQFEHPDQAIHHLVDRDHDRQSGRWHFFHERETASADGKCDLAICPSELFGDRISDWHLLDFQNP